VSVPRTQLVANRACILQVHWVYPYSKMRPANVISTVDLLQLCAAHHGKQFAFVSSTATVEAEHYTRLSDKLVQQGGMGVPETDDLEGSRTGLTTGYGQSKWVAEKVIMRAAERGLTGRTIRPSYIVGDSKTAVTNTDDFLWRLVKGCLQLGLMPDINNTINMVPVDHVALLCSLSGIAPMTTGKNFEVVQVTAHPKIRFNDFLSALPRYGYTVDRCEYVMWRRKLEQHVLEVQDNALFPLLHFVLDDLPANTKAAELDDTNAQALATNAGEAAGAGVQDQEMGRYLAWLVRAGYLAPPTAKGEKALPELKGEALTAMGRTSAS
jgi:L-2-aminoadipate reductase